MVTTKNERLFKVFNSDTGKIEKIVKTIKEGQDYIDAEDPNAEKLDIRLYQVKYKGYLIERNEYPHPVYRWMFTPIEYDGEVVGLGKNVMDCKIQINKQKQTT